MTTNIQCQACGSGGPAPRSDFNKIIPWRCPSCGARHEVECGMGIIGHLKLLDRVTLPPLRVKSETLACVSEATLAINAGAPRAACVMLRRAAERWCADQGASGSLSKKIEELKTRKAIRPVTAAGLDAIRFLGNDAAHLDSRYYDDITIDDAVEAHALIVRLLNSVP